MRTIIISAMAFLSAHAIAQTTVQPMSLQLCFDIASANNLDIKSAEKSVERAKAMQGTAWDLDKTELSLSQDPTSGGSPDNAVSLTQSIEFPTVYIARRAQLKAETQAERSRMTMTKQQQFADIAANYYQLLYQYECIKILLRQDSILSRYLTIATRRFNVGETRKLEKASAERLLLENKQEIAAAKNELVDLQMKLANSMNYNVLVTPVETTLTSIDMRDFNYNFLQTAEGQYSKDLLNVADNAVRVAKNGYAPSLSISLRNQLVISSWDPYNEHRSKYAGGNFMGFEVGIGVPIFFGATKAKVKAAKKEREIAELELRKNETLRKNEFQTAMNRMNTAYGKMNFYIGDGMNNAAEMERLGSLEYENGEISYVEYVDVLQNCIDTNMKRAAAINDYNQAVIAVLKLNDGISALTQKR